MLSSAERILVALDLPTVLHVRRFSVQLEGTGVSKKVGLSLHTALGTPRVVEVVGEDVFLDLKFHDIPNTVADAVETAAWHGVKMLSVHCSGGFEMMQAAASVSRHVAEKSGKRRTLVLGVTELTSLERRDLDRVGIDPRLTMEQLVVQRAQLAKHAGLDGVIASGQEIRAIRAICGPDFVIVTPGIRGNGDPLDDQKRTVSAGEAVRLGATYVVIGRPIVEAANPAARTAELIDEIDAALAPIEL